MTACGQAGRKTVSVRARRRVQEKQRLANRPLAVSPPPQLRRGPSVGWFGQMRKYDFYEVQREALRVRHKVGHSLACAAAHWRYTSMWLCTTWWKGGDDGSRLRG